MLKNFHLAAIVKRRGGISLRQIPLAQALQNTLAESWQAQYDQFIHDGIKEIDFRPGYQPEEDEIFRLSDYTPPDWLAKQDSQTILDLDLIGGGASAYRNNESLLNATKGVAAFSRDNHEEELVLFQNFTPSQVIHPGRLLLLQRNTYSSSDQPGLTLSNRLSAVYQQAKCKLLFQNFRSTNTFLPLSDFYKEASEQEIREVLGHAKFAPEDPDALAIDATQWSRKRFAMLKDSNILDQYSTKQIKSYSRRYDVDIRISNGKIVFPADKQAAKKLLQFLNEELFQGAITETLYETNSKRPADQ